MSNSTSKYLLLCSLGLIITPALARVNYELPVLSCETESNPLLMPLEPPAPDEQGKLPQAGDMFEFKFSNLIEGNYIILYKPSGYAIDFKGVKMIAFYRGKYINTGIEPESIESELIRIEIRWHTKNIPYSTIEIEQLAIENGSVYVLSFKGNQNGLRATCKVK